MTRLTSEFKRAIVIKNVNNLSQQLETSKKSNVVEFCQLVITLFVYISENFDVFEKHSKFVNTVIDECDFYIELCQSVESRNELGNKLLSEAQQLKQLATSI